MELVLLDDPEDPSVQGPELHDYEAVRDVVELSGSWAERNVVGEAVAS